MKTLWMLPIEQGCVLDLGLNLGFRFEAEADNSGQNDCLLSAASFDS